MSCFLGQEWAFTTIRISTPFLAPVYFGGVIFQGETVNRMEMGIALQAKTSL